MPANGQFAHVLERARQDRDDVAQRAQAQADLAAIGARDADDNELTAEQHAARRGHVAWVVQDWVDVAADGQVYDDDMLDVMDDDQRPASQASSVSTLSSSPRCPASVTTASAPGIAAASQSPCAAGTRVSSRP
jgi:hypothetical protein